jgi:hypothetical protein
VTGHELEAACLNVLAVALREQGYQHDEALAAWTSPDGTIEPAIFLGIVGHHAADKAGVLAIYDRAIELVSAPA